MKEEEKEKIKELEDKLKDLTDISGKEIIRLKQQLKDQPKQIFVDIDNSIYDVDGKLIELKSIIDTLEILKKKWCK